MLINNIKHNSEKMKTAHALKNHLSAVLIRKISALDLDLMPPNKDEIFRAMVLVNPQATHKRTETGRSLCACPAV